MKVILQMKVAGGYVDYVEDNFGMHYAPDMAHSCAMVLPHLSGEKAEKVREVAKAARECIASWEIRDERDEKDARRGLEACTKCGA